MENYFLNNPIFLKYKRKFDLKRMRRVPYLKKAIINERIIEIPFTFKALRRIADDGKVLDVGCMESMLPLFMASFGYQVTGFDFREYPYRIPNFDFVRGDILNMPFDENMFDAVTCVSTIEHVGIGFYNDPIEDQDAPDIKGMAQIKKVLKSNGLLVLSVPFGKAYENDQQRVYDKASLNKMLVGFDVKQTKFYKNVYPQDGNNYWDEIELAAAAELYYEAGTDCVCCVSAVKRA